MRDDDGGARYILRNRRANVCVGFHVYGAERIVKNLDGAYPQIPQELQAEDEKLLGACDALLSDVRTAFDKQQFHEALRLIWDVISQSNRYVDSMAPWALKKTDPARMAEVLAVLMEVIRQCAILLLPIMPASANLLLDQLKIAEDQRVFTAIGGSRRKDLPVQIEKPQAVFPRFVEEEKA